MRVTFKDQQLLAVLRDNGRAGITELAAILGVSRSTVQKRLERLEQGGVIAGYTVRLSETYKGSEVRAQVAVIVTPRMTDSIIATMKTRDAVRAVHSVSGPYDLIVEIAAPSVSALDSVIDAIIAIDGVERTETSVILSTRLRR